MKAFIYVQHLVGIGHLRRALLLARAVEAQGMEAVVVSGGRPVPLFSGERVLQLPAAHCRPGDFSTLLDDDGRAVSEDWKRARCRRLLELFDREHPDALVLETFPFGRRQLRFELLPLLERARGRPHRPLVFCSIRDVLQRRTEERERETVALLNRWFDAVWVHGDPRLIALERSFTPVADIQPEVRYTGYVTESWEGGTRSAEPADGVVVSAGGGAAGAALMACAARARHLSSAARCYWHFLVGSDMSREQAGELVELAGPDAVVEPVRSDFRALLAGCRVSVSQLGYNTAIDLMQARARAVVVPFEGDGETEQRTRAEALGQRRLLEVVPEAQLTPQALAAAVDRAAARPRPVFPPVSLDGAVRSARWLAEAQPVAG